MTAQTRSLGEHVAERRKRLALSQSRAAKLAGVSRTSWITWEKGAAMPEDYNYVKIERALEWELGSVEAILSGGSPTAIGGDLPDPAKEVVRATFEEWRKEYGERRARQMINEVLADHPESTRDNEGERGAG